jgi:hypothetical protein
MVKEFEIGKWYNYDEYYIKVLTKTNLSIYGNYIRNGIYSDYDPWSINSLAARSCKELTDLTEIKKFLPNDHPDKFNKIIELW